MPVVILTQSIGGFDWSTIDGSRTAPAAVIQHPTLLDSYGGTGARNKGLIGGKQYQPPWYVAGVDYAVGYPTGTGLVDWQSIGSANINVNVGTSVVTLFDINNATISGVDFSLHNGATLNITNCQNPTVTNCNFGGTNLANVPNAVVNVDVNSPGFIMTNCVMDGAGTSGGAQSSLLSVTGAGTITLKYNWFKNFAQHVIELVQGNTATVSVLYKYNVIEQGALGLGAHLNYLQWAGGLNSTADVEFNTSYQTPQAGAGEGWQFYCNTTGGQIASATAKYNTMIATGGAAGSAMSYHFNNGSAASGGPGSNGSCVQNYMDITAAFGAFYQGAVSNFTGSGNVDMVNAKTINLDNTET